MSQSTDGSTPRPEPRRLRLRLCPPDDRRALAFGVLWGVVGIAALVGAGLIEINVTSAAVARLVGVVVLVLFSVLALMLASDDVARAHTSLTGGHADRVMHWATTALVSLMVVVVLGLVGMVVAPDTPGAANVGWDLAIDLGIGIVGGAVAWALVAVTALTLGRVIWWVQRRVMPERAQRWRPTRGVPFSRQLVGVSRWPLVALGGLMASVACLAIATTLTANRTAAAGVPAARSDSVWLTVVLPLAAWFAGTAIVWALTRPLAVPHHGARRHGAHAIALGVCVVVGFGYASSGTVERHARSELWGRTSNGSGVPRPVSIAGLEPTRQEAFLAAQFAPRLEYAAGERWHATSVSWYVSQNPAATVTGPFCDARVTGADGHVSVPGCYGLPCDDLQGGCADNAPEQPTAYYLGWSGASPPPGDHVPARLGVSWTLIQYWLFYNYDALQTTLIRQWHQGDWEEISVLLARDGTTLRPVEVAFSEHCYGARLPASGVVWQGTHPVAWVAKGSHANYPRPVDLPIRELRCSLGLTPRYLGVAGLFFSPAVDGPSVEVPVGYLAGLTDNTAGAKLGPSLRVISMRSTPAIMAFTGAWGRDNNLGAPVLGSMQAGPGPPAPQTQPPAKSPFASVLCSVRWLGPSRQGLPCG